MLGTSGSGNSHTVSLNRESGCAAWSSTRTIDRAPQTLVSGRGSGGQPAGAADDQNTTPRQGSEQPSGSAYPLSLATRSLSLIAQPDVGVPHRHADVAVARQLTGLDERCTVTQQLGDVSVPTHRVEVGSSLFGPVRDANPLEVLLDHQPGSRSATYEVPWRKWADGKPGDRIKPPLTYGPAFRSPTNPRR